MGLPESGFDMQDFLIRFAELLLQDAVVMSQPVFADIVDGAPVDAFKLQSQFQQFSAVGGDCFCISLLTRCINAVLARQ